VPGPNRLGVAMEHVQASTDQRLSLARELVKRLEADHEDEACHILSELIQPQTNNLFREVGKLTRELHETLNEFRLDERISDLTTNQIPDAKQRLNYVIDMTEESALRTIQVVEEAVPVADTLRERTRYFKNSWDSFRRREMTADEFRQLNRDIDVFLDQTDVDLSKIHGKLSDIMMAQGAQDLSGQIIRQVIELVQKVEGSLVDIIRITGQDLTDKPRQITDAGAATAMGPAVPGVNHGDVVSNQDEVDELLTSLGF
jgi:chemotaxis protein CheZ